MSSKPHFLVTAGNTREKIDRVRDWGNIFTGKTGLDIALAMLEVGNVTLLTSNLQHVQEYDGFSGSAGMLGIETFSEISELESLLAERLHSSPVDAVFMSAAVSDYRPDGAFKVLRRVDATESHALKLDAGQELWVVENVQAGKVKSTHGTIAILGQTTPKLIDMFRSKWNYQGLLIKFKLEVGISEAELIAIGKASRVASGADFIVANTLDMVLGMDVSGATVPGAFVIGPEPLCERVPREGLANRLRELVVTRLNSGV